MNKIDTIISKVRTEYEKRNVLGIVVFGSATRGGFDEYSDVDIYILQKSRPKYSREGFTINGIGVDVIIDGLKEAQAYLKEEKNSVRRNFSHMLSFGKIIYKNGNQIAQLKKKASQNIQLRTTYSKDEVLMHLYSIEDFYGEVRRYASKKDVVSFEQNVNLLINNILECFLKLKGNYFRRPNEMMQVLKKLDSRFAKLIRSCYSSKNINTKTKSLGLLVKYLHKLTKGPLPKNWKVQ